MPTAAIFDLDRTLLPGSSATVFQQHLAAKGLLTERHIPGQDLYRRSYEWFGENPVMMQLARFFVRSAEGWPIADVEDVAEAAAAELEELIQPYARGLFAEHKDAGRKLVLATTSPAPLARLIGVDQDAEQVKRLLQRMGHQVEGGPHGKLKVLSPPYRTDLLHEVDHGLDVTDERATGDVGRDGEVLHLHAQRADVFPRAVEHGLRDIQANDSARVADHLCDRQGSVPSRLGWTITGSAQT